jgi:hypothetical protein
MDLRRRSLASRLCAVLPLALALLGLVGLAPADAAPLAADWQRGADFTAWSYDEYNKGTSDSALQALRDTGTTHVAIVTTWYMDGASDSSIAPDAYKTPNEPSLLHAIATARSLGMTVSLKPHVDVRDGTFRGDIHPASPGAWFAAYRSMLNQYADLAARAGVDTLVVGTELTTMSAYTDEWRRSIAEARARFGGRMTFAANWVQGAEAIQFWGDLDLIGIDSYMPLSTSDPDPSVDALVRAWYERGYVDRVEDLHLRWGKPVIFTEAGFESRVGTAITPWGGATGPISQEAQARAFQATYCVWSQLPWFKGIYWWDWRAAGYDAYDGMHAPRGKLAEGTMRAWNAGAPGACPAIARPPRAAAVAPVPAAAAPAPPAAAAAPRTTITLRARRGRRRAALSGTVRRGRSTCVSSRVRVVVERRVSRRRGWVRARALSARVRRAGRFALAARRLRPGVYRARASLAGRPCGPASSKRVPFRVR